MTDPLDTDDDWADLARELERDKPPAPDPAAPPREELAEAGEDAEGEEFEDAEEGAPGEAGADGDQPGTGRKRRRRRRRRRKGPAEGAVAGAPADAAEDEGEAEAEAEDEPVAEAVAEADDFDAATEDAEPVPVGAEEDTASDVLRELIATWDVPSWDAIVSGLHRPNH